MPGYLQAMGDVKIRCYECAERHQANRPVMPLELVSPDRKQITIHKPRPRRPGLSDEALDALIGLPRAA
ncbi:MAG TPA: hypothetical protein VGM37_04260 [Armatimonadota bacterium]